MTLSHSSTSPSSVPSTLPTESPQYQSFLSPNYPTIGSRKLIIVSHILPYEVEFIHPGHSIDQITTSISNIQNEKSISDTQSHLNPENPLSRKRTNSDWHPLFYDELVTHDQHDASVLSILLQSSTFSDDSTPAFRINPSQNGNVSLFNAIHASKDTFQNYIYIGGLPSLSATRPTKSIIDHLYSQYKCVPILLQPNEIDKYYKGFCKQTLWPIFHYLQLDYTVSRSTHTDADWESYQKVNEIFAETVASHYRPGDLIWIHDYHLLLLPNMLRERLPNATIGFFLHIPFPSSEIFKSLHVREEILLGMLGADLLGFQTYSYARAFLQTTSRIMGFELMYGKSIQIGSSIIHHNIHVDDQLESTTSHKAHRIDDRLVTYGVYPIGIHYEALKARKNHHQIAEMITILKEKYANKKIIIGRDKLDPIKGIRQKLLAYEHFLTKYPEWIGQIVLIQICLSSNAVRSNESDDYFRQISHLVSRINSTYGDLDYTPIIFLQQDISFEHYLALLSIADICIIASLRDGMNLTSHEYVICQEGHYGSLILSEFTGAYHSLGSAAISINPWHCLSIADAINHALNMPLDEKIKRHEQLHRYIVHHHASNWVHHYLNDLVQASEGHSKSISPIVPSFSSIIEAYQFSKGEKLILFDTVSLEWLHKKHQSLFKTLLGMLKHLVKVSSCQVMFHLDDSRTDIEHKYKHLKYFHVTAERGAFIKMNREDKNWNWACTLPTLADHQEAWKEKVKEILDYYTERTPGSFIIENDVSIVWDYSKSDPYFGSWQAKECQTHIQDAIGAVFPIHVLPKRNNQLYILPLNAAFANAWRYFLANMRGSGNGSPISIDYILVIGLGRESELDSFFSRRALSNNDYSPITQELTDVSIFYHDLALPGGVRQLGRLIRAMPTHFRTNDDYIAM